MTLTLSRPVHPGEVLREDFLAPLGLTAYALARQLQIPRTRVERLAREEGPVTTDTALRLARYFGTTPELWLNLQRAYDMKTLGEAKKAEIESIEPRMVVRS